MSNSIFGGEENKKKNSQEFQSKVDTHSKALVTVTQRQKDIESSLELLTEKIDMIDHNTVKDFKQIHNEQKQLKDEINDIKADIKKLKEFNEKISKQLKLFATKDDVQKLEKYIDLWNPLDFVTRDEMKQSQEETLDKLKTIIEKVIEDEPEQKNKSNAKSSQKH